jgi:prolyl oligopeptidase
MSGKSHHRTTACILVLAAVWTSGFAEAEPKTPAAVPAVARRVDTVETIFGHTIADPYRWMEGKDNAEFNAWLSSQGTAGRAWLNSGSSKDAWQARLSAVSQGSTTNRAQHRVAGRTFFQRLENGKQGVLMVRMPDGAEKVLLDPNQMPGDGGHASITNYSVSHDGRTAAINIDRGGAEITTIEFYDVDSGKKLGDELTRVWGENAANWSSDDTAVTYRQLLPESASADFDLMQNQHIGYHVMGTPTAEDRVVLATGLNPTFPLTPREFPGMQIDTQSDWALGYAGGARAESRVCVVRKAELAQSSPKFNCLIDYDDEIQGADVVGSTLFALSFKKTPNGELLAIDLNDPAPSLAKARVVLPEDKTDVLTGFVTAHDALYVRRMHVGQDTFVRLPYGTLKPEAVATRFSGAAYLIDADPRADGFAYTLQGWTRPRQFLAYDPATKTTTDLKLGMTPPKDYSALVEVVERDVRSLDGTMVPVRILQPKGFKPKGTALSLVDAYGGYGISTQPFFDPLTLEWVTAGHVYVLPYIRGGGEKGDAWRLGGAKLNKHKGVEDLIAAVDDLVKRGYSTRNHVGIYGASMGGVIMGGAVAHYPSHFGAAIIHAGVDNPLRLAAAPNGANQFAEVGDPATPEGFESLYRMDPYIAIKDGTAYPPVLIDVGLNDNRVAPWMSGKFGAALIHAGDTQVIFRTDSDSGHFGTSLNQQAAEKADHYAFLEKAMAPAKARKP